jgi:topoisomerase IV subunit A
MIIACADDHVALVGDNRKLLIFALADVPELAGGQGVQLQKYKDGGLGDAICFARAEGLTWPMGGDSGRMRSWPGNEMAEWIGARAQSGRLPPNGFPKSNRFEG